MGRWSRTPELEAARRRPGALTASELRRAPEARCPSRRRIWSAHVLETDLVGTVTAGACTGRSTTGRTAPTTALRAWAAALEISAVRGSRPRDVPARTVSAIPAPPTDSGRSQRRSSVREALWGQANALCRSGDVYGPPTADRPCLAALAGCNGSGARACTGGQRALPCPTAPDGVCLCRRRARAEGGCGRERRGAPNHAQADILAALISANNVRFRRCGLPASHLKGPRHLPLYPGWHDTGRRGT